MNLMKLSSVTSFFGSSLHPHSDCDVMGVSIDSRVIRPNELFVAIVGEKYDGHDFVEKALQQGACAAIVSKKLPGIVKNASTPLILVKDTQKALRNLAELYRSSWTIPVAALTGSCGKTTTKEMIASIFSECYQGKVFATPGNKNNHLGVPLSILQYSKENKAAIFELGANHIGEIRFNVQLVKPQVALITNIGSAHIGEFGGVEAIFSAKSEIFENLPSHGWAIYPYDDVFANEWKKLLAARQTLTFGLNRGADIRAEAIHYDESMCASFQLKTPNGSIAVKLQLPGEHNVLNALAAAALTLVCDVSLEHIAAGLIKCVGVSGRLTFKEGIQGSRVIDDSYNANLQSIEAAMQVLAGFSGKRYLVLGDVGELGQWGEEHHRLIGIKANELQLDGIFTCGTLSYHAHEAFCQLGQGRSEHFENIQLLVERLKLYLDSQTTVVVKGSRSSHMEDVVSAITTVI